MIMTTLLLFGYLRFNRKWHMALVLSAMALFLTLEGANFVANAVKIIHSPYLIVAVAALLGVMFIWYRGRKITNRFLDFTPLADHAQALRDLSDDKAVSYTHLDVYKRQAVAFLNARCWRDVFILATLPLLTWTRINS